ncbi:ABC transporter permease [Skermanella stibiiresistens SB22]|uniref:ABC transporter permease n=1 Tax=Skermanella stibiiresistens SB22 TaxID=1385369 RepID=W9GWW3_9PROT|nr:ABC transporter permease [Skermanella stibiiresistens SB22]
MTLAMSGWTGFAPITLAQKAGIFERNGIQVEIKKMPTSNRHQAMASGDVQAIATTVDTHILYASSGVPVTQVLTLDTSAGGDGVAAREGIGSLKEAKGKSVAVQFGGVPQFWLAYLLKQQGMKLDDVKLTNLEPKDAANAFVAGQFDVAVTYEPYLSTVRSNNAGKIIVTSAETPGVIVDTLAFQPDYIAKNPKVVQAMVKSWFEALDLIKAQPDESFKIMGADVNQTPEQFKDSAKFVKWYDRDMNKTYMSETLPKFLKEANEIMVEAKLVRRPADTDPMVDASFVK